MVSLVLNAFPVIIGIYYLSHYSSEKSITYLTENYGKEKALKKTRTGKMGGVFLIILGIVGFLLLLL